jgi:hypothetical protein
VAEAWATDEIEAVVAAYFEMLRQELAGLPFVKADYNRRVRAMTGRGKGSVEYKLQNISAVLVNHGQVYVKGYLPAQNYQRALESAVLEWLAGRDDLADVIDSSPILNAQPPDRIPPFSRVLVEPPDRARTARQVPSFTPVRIDFVRRDAENRVLGMNGEEFVFELERRRLHDDSRRPDLAKKGAVALPGRWRWAWLRHSVVRADGEGAAHRGEDHRGRHLHEVCAHAERTGVLQAVFAGLPLVQSVRLRSVPEALHATRGTRSGVRTDADAIPGLGRPLTSVRPTFAAVEIPCRATFHA